MTSVTYWNRLEPRPRSADISRALAAEIRDPLWMLTRQWQVGEFQGEDAASPASIELATRSVIASGWNYAPGDAPKAYNAECWPLERVIQEEPLDETDLSLAAELGLLFEDLLLERLFGVDAAGLLARLREALPLRDFAEADARRMPHDPDVDGFLAVCAGRLLDGMALYRRVGSLGFTPSLVFGDLRLDDEMARAVTDALGRFWNEVPAFAGEIERGEGIKPLAWRDDKLRYEAELWASTDDGGFAFSVTPDRDGVCDWWSFDLTRGSGNITGGVFATRRVHPAHVRFRGMPDARWWDFESAATDFGDVQTDRRGLARMAVTEFMLVQGNDWFMLPLQMHVGTLCRIESLKVHDVFGDTVEVPRADIRAETPSGIQRWTMFSTSKVNGEPANFFHLPPCVGATRLDGPVVEEVQFLRDEMANMAWAIEHTVPTQIGEPLSYRNRTAMYTDLAAPSRRGENAPSLVWRLQTEVPSFWYPLLPVHAAGSDDRVVLRLGRTALSSRPEVEQAPPAGRVLRKGGAEVVREWKEEEIAREGLRIVRRMMRSRWIDGSTHVWTMRARETGSGEGTSGLRFDVAAFRANRPEGGEAST